VGHLRAVTEASASARAVLVEVVRAEIEFAQSRDGRCAARASLSNVDSPGAADNRASVRARRARHDALLSDLVRRAELPRDTDTEAVLDLLLGAVWGRVLAMLPANTLDVESLVELVLAKLPRLPH
jgi:hypothetical protein